MRLLILIITILFNCNFVWMQERVSEVMDDSEKAIDPETIKTDEMVITEYKFSPKILSDKISKKEVSPETALPKFKLPQSVEYFKEENKLSEEEFSFLEIEKVRFLKNHNYSNFPVKNYNKQNGTEKFHWKPAIAQSFVFLGIQQSLRMVQKKTSRELDGKFFPDWGASVKNLGGWRDGDSFLTNYIAHPMQGAVTGRIFINNSDRSKRQEFGKLKEYWESRAKAMVWSAIWSAQFELGPISEASIGNVGLYDRTGPNRMGWVDLVVTPTAGTGVIIGEDMIDKYILKKWLERNNSRTRIKIYRTFFTPFQSFTNVLRLKAPWKRDNR